MDTLCVHFATCDSKADPAGLKLGSSLWREASIVWKAYGTLSSSLRVPVDPDHPSYARCRDWAAVHRDLRKPNVTLALLCDEYRAATIDGFGYSCFCIVNVVNPPKLHAFLPKLRV
jgi:hypothetical protein